MPRLSIIAWIAATSLSAPLPAYAGVFTITNSTTVTAYSGNDPYAYFPGPNPYVAQAPIGAEFETSALTVRTQAEAGFVLVDFSYSTRFDGSETVDGRTVSYADIFLSAVNVGGTQGFGYAIALGQQMANGGLAAGFYSVGDAASSQSIWSSRAGFVYGGAYGAGTGYTPGQAGYSAALAPTVLTAGVRLSGATITQTSLAHGWYDVDAQIAMTQSQAAYFVGGMEVFWGTGDCANGAFLAEVPDFPVAEPCSAAILVSAIGFMMVRRKLRARSR